MPRVDYFQRYSQRENVVTNNTLLLFSHLYAFSPARLESLLGSLLGDSDLIIGLDFQQQVRGKGSVPDARITQGSFSLVIETKVDATVNAMQLKSHIQAFNGEEQKFLMLIQPAPLSDERQAEIVQSLKAADPEVRFCAATFEDIVKGCEDIIQDYETDLRELLDDYREYCSSEGLLPTAPHTMRVVVAGAAYQENFKYSLYYCPADRGYQPHEYMGLYHRKTVVGVGRIHGIASVEIQAGKVRVIEHTGEVTEEDKKRILAASEEAAANRGWVITKDNRFFLVDEFVETSFKKTTKYPLQGVKYFDLRQTLSVAELPGVNEIADQLKREEW